MSTDTRTYTKRHRSGAATTWVKLNPGEQALIIRDGRHYRLGGQVDDIVGGHVLTEAKEVYWCSITQAWVESGADTKVGAA